MSAEPTLSPVLDAFRLDGKVAIVTGASSGLGVAFAQALAEAGADVALGARRAERLEDTKKLVEAAGRRAVAVATDVADPDHCNALVDAAIAEFGRVDILVNNAGTIRRAAALDVTEADWDAVLDVNLKSVFFLSQGFARRMVADEGGGKIIHVASMMSFQGGIRIASYTAAKSGLAGLTRLMANEWAPLGINVNAIAPGYFATNNTAALRADPDRNGQILARIPAARWGEPRDLGGAAVFLASPAAAYVHGILLPVDGGWLAR
jgi:2-dehydro-3-deoxy-D-gluconate 5-dehydrogenase